MVILWNNWTMLQCFLFCVVFTLEGKCVTLWCWGSQKCSISSLSYQPSYLLQSVIKNYSFHEWVKYELYHFISFFTHELLEFEVYIRKWMITAYFVVIRMTQERWVESYRHIKKKLLKKKNNHQIKSKVRDEL